LPTAREQPPPSRRVFGPRQVLRPGGELVQALWHSDRNVGTRASAHGGVEKAYGRILALYGRTFGRVDEALRLEHEAVVVATAPPASPPSLGRRRRPPPPPPQSASQQPRHSEL
jgi:hypothetical protein